MKIEQIWDEVRYYGIDPDIQVEICRAVERLPDEVQTFVFERCVFLSVGRSAWGMALPPDQGDDPYWLKDSWLIVVADDLPQDDAAGIIAHEIAHALLGHDAFDYRIGTQDDYNRTESEAAELAKAWGFTGRGARVE